MTYSDVAEKRTDIFLLLLLLFSLGANVALAFYFHRSVAVNNALISEVNSSKSLSAKEMNELTTEEAPTLGSHSSPVKMVIFSDFECPYCQHFARTLKQVSSDKASSVQIFYRELPLPMHKFARREAELGYCVKRQSNAAFWDYFTFIYAQTDNKGDLTDRAITYLGSRPGIDTKSIRTCVDRHETAQDVDHDIDLANRYSVNSTPTVFVDGIRVTGQMREPQNLAALIDKQAIKSN